MQGRGVRNWEKVPLNAASSDRPDFPFALKAIDNACIEAVAFTAAQNLQNVNSPAILAVEGQGEFLFLK